MKTTGNSVCDPVRAILDARGDAVLALVAGVVGPSYRPVGASMAIEHDAGRTGSLSSGCVENDIALHAARVLETGKPEIIRYGEGSPYVDIQLPCGGGLDILLLPNPDRQALAEIVDNYEQRQPCTLDIDLGSGALTVSDSGETGRENNRLSVRFEPDIAFQVFGKGPAALTFAALVRSAGFPCLLLSPDRETLDAAGATGCAVRELVAPKYPDDLDTDYRTAIVAFFHDRDWEPPILAGALETPAFYIGAQGSRQSRDLRLTALEEMGVSEEARARLKGPIGLFPSARDARTLAVSVLAEVLATSMPAPTK
jgi:xanthine dehydrogenase accessory factor